MFVTLGVLSWNAYTTFEIAKDMAATKVSILTSKERDAAQDIELASLRVRMSALEIKIAELRR